VVKIKRLSPDGMARVRKEQSSIDGAANGHTDPNKAVVTAHAMDIATA